MQGKITLITPPDIFENESYSILFVHLTDSDQEKVSKWLANSSLTQNINIYSVNNETDMPWLLHAVSRCDYRFIDLNGASWLTTALGGYLLGKKNTYYKIDDENLSAVYHYINQDRITNIETFLEKAFNEQNKS